jgi:polyribonucleotide nucleotidyltransferase
MKANEWANTAIEQNREVREEYPTIRTLSRQPSKSKTVIRAGDPVGLEIVVLTGF